MKSFALCSSSGNGIIVFITICSLSLYSEHCPLPADYELLQQHTRIVVTAGLNRALYKQELALKVGLFLALASASRYRNFHITLIHTVLVFVRYSDSFFAGICTLLGFARCCDLYFVGIHALLVFACYWDSYVFTFHYCQLFLFLYILMLMAVYLTGILLITNCTFSSTLLIYYYYCWM